MHVTSGHGRRGLLKLLSLKARALVFPPVLPGDCGLLLRRSLGATTSLPRLLRAARLRRTKPRNVLQQILYLCVGPHEIVAPKLVDLRRCVHVRNTNALHALAATAGFANACKAQHSSAKGSLLICYPAVNRLRGMLLVFTARTTDNRMRAQLARLLLTGLRMSS